MPQYVQQTVEFEAERSRLNEWLVILLFGAILLTPFVTQLIGFSTGTTTENRVLAPLPKINSLREIKFLPKMSENYVNDRFGLRQQLVHFNSAISVAPACRAVASASSISFAVAIPVDMISGLPVRAIF
jgi:hypothetical protein